MVTERLPEEELGTAGALRKRMEELEALADGCDTEALELTESAARLRTRAARLREQALEYRYAAHAVETAPADRVD